MNNLKKSLAERFGIDGNGILAQTEWLGRDNTKVTVEEFELWSGAKLNNRKGNDYDSEDCKITLIDEAGDDLEITLEIKDEVITHSYY